MQSVGTVRALSTLETDALITSTVEVHKMIRSYHDRAPKPAPSMSYTEGVCLILGLAFVTVVYTLAAIA